MGDLVEVLDITLVTTTPGLTLHHTIRQHEGDALVENETGMLTIQYGSRKVAVGNEERELAGRRVTLEARHIVETTMEPRLEPRERPSIKALMDRRTAEVEELKKKHGLTPKGK